MEGWITVEMPTGEDGTYPLKGIVPARAVLTELARGFLLVNDSDRDRARRFAATFLKEHSGPASAPRVISLQRFPTVRRGYVPTPRDE